VRTCAALVLGAITSLPLPAQPFECAEEGLPPELVEVYEACPLIPGAEEPIVDEDVRGHRLVGTASYYADRFEGRRTASGERFTQGSLTAAHRTLPLGTWVEVTSLATGRKLNLKVNDRGPFSGGFILDLSRSAARFLGVDRAHDRRVRIRVIALPGAGRPAGPAQDGSRVRAGTAPE
jgi:rare lipoprotein A (peptidoglycan hydrolase)